METVQQDNSAIHHQDNVSSVYLTVIVRLDKSASLLKDSADKLVLLTLIVEKTLSANYQRIQIHAHLIHATIKEIAQVVNVIMASV